MSKAAVTVKAVNARGFAFATTDDGRDVFLPGHVHAALGKPARGARVTVFVKMGDKGLFGSVPRSATEVSWAEWQTGEGQVRLPDTVPGSSHEGISLHCFRCGQCVVREKQIWKVKDTCIWTTQGVPASIIAGTRAYNEFKKTHVMGAQCAKCKYTVGSIYPEPFENVEDPHRKFPCAKLYSVRENKGTDALYNSLVLGEAGASKSLVDAAISRLSTVSGRGVGVRVTREMYRQLKEIEELKRQLESSHIDNPVELPKSYKPARTCIEEMHACAPKLSLGDIGSFLISADRKARTASTGADVDGRFALYLYTGSSCLYQRLNEDLRERDPSKIKVWYPFLYYINRFLKTLPNYNGVVYRGMPVPSNIAEYTRDKQINWSAYSSTSKSETVAQSFASATGIVFRIHLLHGREIQAYSWFSQESEILLHPNMRFLVRREQYSQCGHTYIDLQEIPSDVVWT